MTKEIKNIIKHFIVVIAIALLIGLFVLPAMEDKIAMVGLGFQFGFFSAIALIMIIKPKI